MKLINVFLFLLLSVLLSSKVKIINEYSSKKINVKVLDIGKKYVIRLYLPEDLSTDEVDVFLWRDDDKEPLIVKSMAYSKDFECFYIMLNKVSGYHAFTFHVKYRIRPEWLYTSLWVKHRRVFKKYLYFGFIQMWGKDFSMRGE